MMNGRFEKGLARSKKIQHLKHVLGRDAEQEKQKRSDF